MYLMMSKILEIALESLKMIDLMSSMEYLNHLKLVGTLKTIHLLQIVMKECTR